MRTVLHRPSSHGLPPVHSTGGRPIVLRPDIASVNALTGSDRKEAISPVDGRFVGGAQPSSSERADRELSSGGRV